MRLGRLFGLAFAAGALWFVLLAAADSAGGAVAVIVVCALIVAGLVAFVACATREPVENDAQLADAIREALKRGAGGDFHDTLRAAIPATWIDFEKLQWLPDSREHGDI